MKTSTTLPTANFTARRALHLQRSCNFTGNYVATSLHLCCTSQSGSCTTALP